MSDPSPSYNDTYGYDDRWFDDFMTHGSYSFEEIQQENALWPWLDSDCMADHECEEGW